MGRTKPLSRESRSLESQGDSGQKKAARDNTARRSAAEVQTSILERSMAAVRRDPRAVPESPQLPVCTAARWEAAARLEVVV